MNMVPANLRGRTLLALFLLPSSLSLGTPQNATDKLGGALVSQYDDLAVNEINEREIQLTIKIDAKKALVLKVPFSQVDTNSWFAEGRLTVDWSHCQSREFLRGGGELSQCLRRAELSLDGEMDRLKPGVLELQILKQKRLAISLSNQDLSWSHLTATFEGQGKGLDSLFEGLNEELLPDQSPFAKGLLDDLSKSDAKQVKSGAAASFIFLGDTGTGTTQQYAVGKAMQRFCVSDSCQFALLLGDNFYEMGVSSTSDSKFKTHFEEPYKNLLFKFYAVLGNHDHYGNSSAQVAYTNRSTKWVMPSRYYSFTQGNVEFFAIDSDDFDTTQKRWLETQLRNSTAMWKIVLGHHPVYSYGSHGDTEELIDSLLPLLRTYKVDFYLAGHDHDKQYIEKYGVRFLVIGTGAKLRTTQRGRDSLFASATLGFAHLQIQDNQATVRLFDEDVEEEYRRVITK